MASHTTDDNAIEAQSFTTNVFTQETTLIAPEVGKVVIVASQPRLAVSKKIDEAQAPRLAEWP